MQDRYIFILTVRDREFGRGHWVRSRGFADLLEGEGWKVKIALVSSDQNQDGVDILKSPDEVLAQVQNSGIVMIDSPGPGLDWLPRLRERNLFIVGVETPTRWEDYCEIVVDSNREQGGRIAGGPEFAFVRPEIVRLRRKLKDPGISADILLAPGGSASRSWYRTAGDLARKFPGVERIFASGRVTGLMPGIIPVRKEEYLDRVRSTGMVICGGGVTMKEMLCLGKPSLVLPKTDAEQNNFEFYRSKFPLLQQAEWGTLSRELWKNGPRRIEFFKRARKVVDGRAGERIMNVLADRLNTRKTGEELL